MHSRALQLIDELGLAPHPEGGFYREIHRSELQVDPHDARESRAAMTTIYFLLAAPSFSRWHAVASDEIWHLYEGGPLELRTSDPLVNSIQVTRLDRVSKSTFPVAVVHANHWQAARPLGDYALIGATVAPGFEFADFSFLASRPELAERMTDPTDRELL